MRIYTITLNPAYDLHAISDDFTAYRENIVTVTSKDAGGKGVNISRALNVAGVKNTAVIVLGRGNGKEFKKLVSDLDTVIIEKDGNIRENLTIHTGKKETRISFCGFSLDDSVLDDIYNNIIVDCETVITFTGSVPDGVSMKSVKRFLGRLKSKGGLIVIDSRSFSLNDIYELSPWLIKPNEQEISNYFKQETDSLSAAAEKAEIIHSNGVENVIISLGERGAVLLGNDGCFSLRSPKIQAISTIGAGDSLIAGFIKAKVEGYANEKALKVAVAFGSAACLTEGTCPPLSEDIKRIYEKL